ncbi:MAG TPA: VCBS repeat-containing protein, partial [Ktedonobacteraceae bacterium]|nr:VCBS repeat-containing protein [Ktedonobacteraceae bacterium]
MTQTASQSAWSTLPAGPALSDADGWNQPQYYSTIQTADVDGDGLPELLARGSAGINLWKCSQKSFQWNTLPAGPALSDANNWNQPQYYSTIHSADLDGDGQAELLARASGGISVWKCNKASY